MPTLRIVLISILIIVAGYGIIEALPMLSGPQLTVTSPTNSTSVGTHGLIAVSGHVTRVVALTLNGDPLIPDANGSFATALALPQGTSILRLTARDRFGHTVTDTRTLYVQ